MLLYMTYWFPQSYRSRFIATFMAAIPLSNAIGGPISTSILEMEGIWGLHGWQWMFIIEGLPATLFAFLALKLLPDRPASASWLNPDEKQFIAQRLAKEDTSDHHDIWPALKDPRVYAIGLILSCNQVGLYGIQLWMPLMIQSMGIPNFWNGWVSAIPFAVAMVAMIWWGRRSDLKRERIWHVAIPLLLAAGSLMAASMSQHVVVVLFFLTLGLAGTLAYNGPFFSLPSTFLAGTAAAGGLGFVNTLGSVGRAGGPPLVGYLKEQSGNYSSAMVAMALCMLIGAVTVLILGRVMAARTAALAAKASGGA
jgi:ACS family tartrate transporter-like MFS transporter